MILIKYEYKSIKNISSTLVFVWFWSDFLKTWCPTFVGHPHFRNLPARDGIRMHWSSQKYFLVSPYHQLHYPMPQRRNFWSSLWSPVLFWIMLKYWLKNHSKWSFLVVWEQVASEFSPVVTWGTKTFQLRSLTWIWGVCSRYKPPKTTLVLDQNSWMSASTLPCCDRLVLATLNPTETVRETRDASSTMRHNNTI